MKKVMFYFSFCALIITGCSSLTSSGGSSSSGAASSGSSGSAVSTSGSSGPGSLISGIFNRIPSDLREEVNNRVDSTNELYGFGTANSDRIGASAGQMKSFDNAKSDLNNKIKRESQRYLNEHYNSLDPNTKTMVRSALPELVKHTTELSEYNIAQKGAWESEDEKRIHSLVTINKADIETHARNVFTTYLDDISERFATARSSM